MNKIDELKLLKSNIYLQIEDYKSKILESETLLINTELEIKKLSTSKYFIIVEDNYYMFSTMGEAEKAQNYFREKFPTAYVSGILISRSGNPLNKKLIKD